MTGLPAALAPWKSELDVFPREVALSIGGWLPKLALLIGPYVRRTAPGGGPPDGFSGVARRGPYERLLLSEWMLAGEMPDEFLRRAAMSEHTFLEIARTKPHGSKRSVALFDAGPSQLGAPRLLHIALLVVLKQRAASVGADFAWGVIQDPEGWLFDGLTESSVLALLKARGAHEASEIDLEDWAERLEIGNAPDDMWLVGAPRIASIKPDVTRSFAAIDELIDRERRIRARITRAAAKGRLEAPVPDLILDLPPERASVRLLRDPFELARPPPWPKVLSEPPEPWGFTLSADGRRLFVRDPGVNFVIAYAIPNSPSAQAALPRRLSTMSGEALAVGMHRRTLRVVTADGGRISLRAYSKKGRLISVLTTPEVDARFSIWRPGQQAPLSLCLPIHPSGFDDGAMFVDAVGRLIVLRSTRESHSQLVADIAASGVTALARVKGELVAVINRDSPHVVDESPSTEERRRYMASIATRALMHRTGLGPRARGEVGLRPTRDPLDRSDCVVPMTEELTGDGPLTAFFGNSGGLEVGGERGMFGLVAIAQHTGFWTISWRSGLEYIIPPIGARVFGVTLAADGAPALVVIESDGRTIALVGKDHWSSVASSPLPIKRAVCCSAGAPVAAYLDDAGDLHVISLHGGTALAHIRAEEHGK